MRKQDYELCNNLGLELARGKFKSFEEAEGELGKIFKGSLIIRNIETMEEKSIKRELVNKSNNKKVGNYNGKHY